MNKSFFVPPDFTYDYNAVIGEGEFGQVFLGTLTATNTPICVKITWDRNDESFEREFELLAKLRGKEAIIQTYGYSVTRESRRIVLERADGSLEKLLNLPRHSEGFPMQTILDLIGDLAKALTALNDMKVAHRDIKPMNILYFTDKASMRIGERYKFKLCDFGCGRPVLGMKNPFDTIAGTPCYMSPQALARQLELHGEESEMNAEKSDMWSLAVTLYECITGRLPFDPSPFNLQELLKVLNGRGEAIAYHNGKYEKLLQSSIHPRWFLEVMSMIIFALLLQRDYMQAAALMDDLSKQRSRVVYNVRRNVFHVQHPHPEDALIWGTYEYIHKPSDEVVDEAESVCVLNERKEVNFIGPAEVENNNNTEKLSDDENEQGINPPTTVNDIPGTFLPPVEFRKEEMKLIDEMFTSHPLVSCSARAHYELIVLQTFVDNLHQLSDTIERQREHAINRLRKALDQGQRKPNRQLREHAVATFSTRTPEEFRMPEADLHEPTQILEQCLKILVHMDDQWSREIGADEYNRMKSELIAMIKFIITAQRKLQKAVVHNRHGMMSALRRIIEFNELAENLEAEFNGHPLPHDFCLVSHAISCFDLRYEKPPGNLSQSLESLPDLTERFDYFCDATSVNIIDDSAADDARTNMASREASEPSAVKKSTSRISCNVM